MIIFLVAKSHFIDPYLTEYYGFAFAFLIGYAMAPALGMAHSWLLPLLGVGVVAGFGLPGYRYTTAAALLLSLATRPGWPTWPLATKFPPFAYEWFLIHGLCLHAVYTLGKEPWVVFALALPLSSIAAIVFRWSLDSAGSAVQKLRVGMDSAAAPRNTAQSAQEASSRRSDCSLQQTSASGR